MTRMHAPNAQMEVTALIGVRNKNMGKEIGVCEDKKPS